MANAVTIGVGDVLEVMTPDKGWQIANLQPGFPENIKETVMDWPVPRCPGLVLRVYTSVLTGEGTSRDVGKDAIRVCAVDLTRDQGLVKTTRVNRVEGWRDNLRARCMEVLKLARQRYKPLPKPEPSQQANGLQRIDPQVADVPVFKFKKDRLAWFRDQIVKHPGWALDVMLRVYDRQTDEEQGTGVTIEDNGVGFSGVDAELMTSFCEQWNTKGWLSPKQQGLMMRVCKKYARQYIDILTSEGVAQIN